MINSTPAAAPTTAALSPEPDLVAFVAIDWADQKHALVLLPAGSQTKETFTLEHTPEALSDWVAQLFARFAQGKIAVILEQSRGALLYALLPHDRLQLYPINPKTSANSGRPSMAVGPKTIRWTPTSCWTSCSTIGTGSKPGTPMSRSRANSNCWSRRAAALSPTRCA
jgi:hypothetical protein